MKKDNDKAIDDLFKKKLGNPEYETGYREEDWHALEKLLDDEPKKRPGIIFWLPILSSAAALLIFFGWWFFKPQVISHVKHNQQDAVVVNHTNKNSNSGNGKASKNEGDNTTPKTISRGSGNNSVISGHENKQDSEGNNSNKELAANAINSNKKHSLKTARHDFIVSDKSRSIISGQNSNEKIYKPGTATLLAVRPGLIIDDVSANMQDIDSKNVVSRDIVGNLYKPNLEKDDKGVTKTNLNKRPQYALTFMGAPELNSVNSLSGSKSGTNLGLLFSVGLFNKITVSTGATYAIKPYNTSFANYHTNYKFKTDPSSIEADCRVLDIPVNVDYQLYNKSKNKFSLGTGLSSYIMLHESYNYYYSDPNTKGPSTYTVPNTNKYFFGILNLQATYQRQLNSKVGLSIQPYMKLPLTNIGASQVKLQTTGVAIGLNWNLNSLTKP